MTYSLNLKASAGMILDALKAEDIVARRVNINAMRVMSKRFRYGISDKKLENDPDSPKKSS